MVSNHPNQSNLPDQPDSGSIVPKPPVFKNPVSFNFGKPQTSRFGQKGGEVPQAKFNPSQFRTQHKGG